METKQSIRERLQLRLGPRLIGLVMLTALVAGGLVGAVLIENGRSVVREDILESNLATADLAAQFAANYVEGAETNLRQFATRTLFLRAIFDHDVEQAELPLAEFLQIDARFDSISVYDATGIGWASGLMDKWQNRGGTVADREWFQQTLATKKPYFGIPVISRATGHAIGVYVVPIFDDQGEIRAVLGGGISLAALSDAITGLRVSASARASLMDARQGGIIVAHSDPQRILTPVTEQDAAALRAIAGERGTMETRSSSGELALAAYAPVPRLPWAVVILQPAEAAFAPVNALTQRALLLIGIATLIAAVLGVLLARTITQPVRQLVIGAEEIGRGNLEYRIEVAARDEIGQLSQAFNQMTENLQAITASRDELNREITERKRAEEKHGLIIKTALDGFWINDLKGRVLEVNESYCSMIGYTREELLTMSISDIEALEKPEDIAQRMKKVIEQGHDRFETRHRRKDGKILDVEISINYVPIVGEEQCFVFIRDITARRQAEEARVKAVSAVVDAMGDALLLHTLDGEITFVNPAFERMVGYKKSELVGRDVAEVGAKVTKPEDAEITASSIEAALKGEALIPAPVTLVSKEGREIPAAFTVSFMKDAAGEPSTAVVVFKDITALKRTEAELEASRRAALNMMADAEEARRMAERANEELRREVAERKRAEEELARSNRELEQFAYVASHDLQEPLRKVQVFGDQLKAKQAQAFDDEGRDYLERMQDAARRMQKMINDLLTFSRVATRAQPFVPVNLRRVAQGVLSDLEIQIEQTDGRIVIGDLPTIEADPTQMRQLLENLIGNGLKFHREGVAPVVEIASKQIDEPEGALCQVFVKDNGIGLDEKYLDRLFKPFQRLHGRGEYPGTGIGLAICRRIAERHGGDITVQSAPGEGATFIVTLPVHQSKLEDVKRET